MSALPAQRVMRLSCLATPEAIAEIADEWEALFARIDDAHPSTSCAWVVAWKNYLEQGTGLLRSSLRVYAIRGEDDALIAVVPAVNHTLVLFGVVVARLLIMGMGSQYVEPCTLLVAPSDECAAVNLLAEAIDPSAYDAVLWTGLRVPGSAMEELLAIPGARKDFGFSHLIVPLPDTWAAMESGLSRYMRKTLRRNHNALVAGKHDFSFAVLETAADIDSALDRFFTLQQALPRGNKRNADYLRLDTPRARGFLRSLIAALIPTGVVRIFQLSIGGHVVAMRIGIVYRGGLYHYFFADDPTWKKYGVLTTTMAEMFKYAIAQRYRFVYLSTVRRYSNMRWRPLETPVGQVIVWNVTLRARLWSMARTARREFIRFARRTSVLVAEMWKRCRASVARLRIRPR